MVLGSGAENSTSARRKFISFGFIHRAITTSINIEKNLKTFQLLLSILFKSDPASMGKVHGSLARAGKVKSQTPKVSVVEHMVL